MISPQELKSQKNKQLFTTLSYMQDLYGFAVEARRKFTRACTDLTRLLGQDLRQPALYRSSRAEAMRVASNVYKKADMELDKIAEQLAVTERRAKELARDLEILDEKPWFDAVLSRS